jgi:hypothetical protein
MAVAADISTPIQMSFIFSSADRAILLVQASFV